jgi:orotate phosphoribosyltransferase-like protein
MTETVKELVERAKEQLEKGDSPTNFRGEINFTKATVFMLMALCQQNKEMIAQNEIIIKYMK